MFLYVYNSRFLYILLFFLERFINGEYLGPKRVFSDSKNRLVDRWPFIAALIDHKSGEAFCSGVLISVDLVLTAAQCLEHTEPDGIKVQRSIKSFRVILNCEYLKKDQCIQHEVEMLLIHPKHLNLLHENDLAMLKLQLNFIKTPSSIVRLITRPKYSSIISILDLNQCFAIGYGYPSRKDSEQLTKPQRQEIEKRPPGSLHMMTIPLISDSDTCSRYYQVFKPPHTFCAGPEQSSMVAFYRADYGSPLLCPTHEHNYYLLGLTTLQLSINRWSHLFPPVLFTNLTNNDEWIQSAMKILKALRNSRHFRKWIYYRQKHPTLLEQNDTAAVVMSSLSKHDWHIEPLKILSQILRFLIVIVSLMIAGYYYYHYKKKNKSNSN